MDKFYNLIRQNKWIFARTMPGIPHYYIVKDDLSNDDKKLFDEFDEYIKMNGYSREFYSKKYIYVNIDDYKYWVIDNILNKAKI